MTKDQLLRRLDVMFENEDDSHDKLTLDVVIEVVQQPLFGVTDRDVNQAYKAVTEYHTVG